MRTKQLETGRLYLNNSIKIASALFFLGIAFNSYSSNEVWNQKSSLPGEARHRATGFSIANKGYIGLGHYNSGPNGNVQKADIWEYDPGSESWTQKADYGFGGTYGATAFTVGQYAYVGAHVNNGSQFYKFDPIANTWTLIAPSPYTESERCSFTIGEFGYVVYSNNLARYDPITDSWTDMGPSPGYVYAWSSAFSIGDKGYLLASSSLFEYKPTTNAWAWRAPFPGEATGGRATFTSNGKGYIFGGYIGGLSETTNQLWEFNPYTNEWIQEEDLPGATRRFSSSFTIGNKGFIATGTNGTNMKDLWEFDQLLSTTTEEKITFNIYPNPTQGAFNIKFESVDIEKVSISIVDISGKEVLNLKPTSQSFNIDISELKNGSYICAISNDSELIGTNKITKY